MRKELFKKLNELYGVTATQAEIDEILNLLGVGDSLRDHLAAMSMQAEIYSLNTMPKDRVESYRGYLYQRWGEMTMTEAIAKEAYDAADALLKARVKKSPGTEKDFDIWFDKLKEYIHSLGYNVFEEKFTFKRSWEKGDTPKKSADDYLNEMFKPHMRQNLNTR